MKIEWRKQFKNLYLPKEKPEIIEPGEMTFISITGEGSPDSEVFSNAVEALYSLSYAIKMSPRNGYHIDGYQEYAVFPLEGIWNLNEEGRKLNSNGISANDLRDYYTFTLMIRQPDFITEEIFLKLRDISYNKKLNPTILKAEYLRLLEPLSCQMMHIGPYSEEPVTFSIMEKYTEENGYIRKEKYHKEIYISDPRKVSPENMKTVLRFEVSKK